MIFTSLILSEFEYIIKNILFCFFVRLIRKLYIYFKIMKKTDIDETIGS